jgi:small subunit ribosomal protein S1
MTGATTTVPETEETEDSVWITGPDGTLIPDYDSTIPEINEGEVVRGTVVRVDKDEVLVDKGYKSEGVVPVTELSIRRSVNPLDEVQLGDELDALVMTMEDTEGRLILSKKRARFEMAWKRIEGANESGEPVEGNVIEVVKGGLILDLGVRGFLPASLVDIRRVQNLDEFMGRTLTCRVIELNRSRNNVVLSRRAVLEEERKEARQAILDQLSPGDIVEGVISNIVDFGAFVDLNGIDGLIHISELSWSHVNHPSEILEISQKVEVKVLDIDRERQRISLGLKQTQADPWQQVVDAYSEMDVVHGRVTKVVTFGAFIEILPGVEGLVHISELAEHHVETPREVVAQGDLVEVKIIEMDPDRRRLSLSIKRVEPEDEVQPAIMDFSKMPLPESSVTDDEELAAEAAAAALAAVPAEPTEDEPAEAEPTEDAVTEAEPVEAEPAAEAVVDAPVESEPPAEDTPSEVVVEEVEEPEVAAEAPPEPEAAATEAEPVEAEPAAEAVVDAPVESEPPVEDTPSDVTVEEVEPEAVTEPVTEAATSEEASSDAATDAPAAEPEGEDEPAADSGADDAEPTPES